MKLTKWLMPFGMLGVLSFLLLDILGKILWPEYDPITTYVSKLVANESPHVHLMRVLMNTYTICFLFFSFSIMILYFSRQHMLSKVGYTIMFFSSLISMVGYGGYPISMEKILSKNDVIHLLVTILILISMIISFLFIAAGYIKQEKLKILGWICLSGDLLLITFNLWHLFVILNNIHIFGLIQRLTFYTFHTLIFIISWFYTFKKEK